MDKETTTSVTIDRKTFARLDRLAKSNNVSKKEFLCRTLMLNRVDAVLLEVLQRTGKELFL